MGDILGRMSFPQLNLLPSVIAPPSIYPYF